MIKQQAVILSPQSNFINQNDERSIASVFLISSRKKKLRLLYVYEIRNHQVKELLLAEFFLISKYQDITFVVLLYSS